MGVHRCSVLLCVVAAWHCTVAGGSVTCVCASVHFEYCSSAVGCDGRHPSPQKKIYMCMYIFLFCDFNLLLDQPAE
jgi:hypothetical protein